jgi:hypothetical protein
VCKCGQCHCFECGKKLDDQQHWICLRVTGTDDVLCGGCMVEHMQLCRLAN